LTKLPAEVQAYCECHPHTSVDKPAAAAAALLPLGDRIKVIVHPFLAPESELKQWMELFGNRVAHSHIQIRTQKDFNQFASLSDYPEVINGRMDILLAGGFSGSFTIEFVKGTGEADNPDKLFNEAVKDREVLIRAIATRS
jgi:hypothetical protein